MRWMRPQTYGLVCILLWSSLATAACQRRWTAQEVEQLLNEQEQNRALAQHVPRLTNYRECRDAGPDDPVWSVSQGNLDYICQKRSQQTPGHGCMGIQVQKMGLKVGTYYQGAPVFAMRVLINDDRTPSEKRAADVARKNQPCD